MTSAAAGVPGTPASVGPASANTASANAVSVSVPPVSDTDSVDDDDEALAAYNAFLARINKPPDR